jgi:acyl carrier protein
MESFVDTALRARVVDTMLALLPELLGRGLPGLSEDTGLIEELALSSTKGMELLLSLEQDLDLQHLTTVATLADYVVAHLLETDGTEA